MTQKTVYDLKLLVIFFKKLVMFFKKLVMFYQSLVAPCCFPVYSLIIYKTVLDKIRLIHDVKGCICKISSTTWPTELTFVHLNRQVLDTICRIQLIFHTLRSKT